MEPRSVRVLLWRMHLRREIRKIRWLQFIFAMTVSDFRVLFPTVGVTPDFQGVRCFKALNNSTCSQQANQILLIRKVSASLHQRLYYSGLY